MSCRTGAEARPNGASESSQSTLFFRTPWGEKSKYGEAGLTVTMPRVLKTLPWLLMCLMITQRTAQAYDPTDKEIPNIVPPTGTFEAFYPREMYGVKNGNARPAHAHGSFYAHRNPALVEVRNAAAYGFRFDGKRRFNFD
uniref:Uncharacterized protein n=1 Tax=Anopheles maculatus TaxID=74869 RepID=A0A182SIG6_9DIPT